MVPPRLCLSARAIEAALEALTGSQTRWGWRSGARWRKTGGRHNWGQGWPVASESSHTRPNQLSLFPTLPSPPPTVWGKNGRKGVADVGEIYIFERRGKNGMDNGGTKEIQRYNSSSAPRRRRFHRYRIMRAKDGQTDGRTDPERDPGVP